MHYLLLGRSRRWDLVHFLLCLKGPFLAPPSLTMPSKLLSEVALHRNDSNTSEGLSGLHPCKTAMRCAASSMPQMSDQAARLHLRPGTLGWCSKIILQGPTHIREDNHDQSERLPTRQQLPSLCVFSTHGPQQDSFQILSGSNHEASGGLKSSHLR